MKAREFSVCTMCPAGNFVKGREALCPVIICESRRESRRCASSCARASLKRGTTTVAALMKFSDDSKKCAAAIYANSKADKLKNASTIIELLRKRHDQDKAATSKAAKANAALKALYEEEKASAQAKAAAVEALQAEALRAQTAQRDRFMNDITNVFSAPQYPGWTPADGLSDGSLHFDSSDLPAI